MRRATSGGAFVPPTAQMTIGENVHRKEGNIPVWSEWLAPDWSQSWIL